MSGPARDLALVSDADLGAQIGAALRRRSHDGATSGLSIGDVRSGARRRRRTRRALGAAAAVSAFVSLVGVTLALDRDSTPTPASQPLTVPPNPPVSPSVLPAYAMLVDADGNVTAPNSLSANRGSVPYGMPQPAVDVWTRDGATIVIQTVRLNDGTTTTDQAPATTAAPTASGEPWGDRVVSRGEARGVTVGVEQLAEDQFALWVPEGSNARYTLVMARGMDQRRLVEVVDGMEQYDGVLEPVGFERVHHAPALPAEAPAPAWADASFTVAADDSGAATADLWLSTSVTAATSVELTTLWFQIGVTERIGGRDVLVSRDPSRDFTSATWLEPGGVVVRMATGSSEPIEDLIARVRLVGPSEWTQARAALAERIAAELPVRADVELAGVAVDLRGDTRRIAMCLTVGEAVDCGATEPPRRTNEPINALAQAEVGGEWIFAGRWEGPEDDVTIDDIVFQDATNQVIARPEWVYADGGYWFVARMPAGVDVIQSNLGYVLGGPSGWFARPEGVAVSW